MLNMEPISISAIEELVYYKLIENNNPATARAYENYKAVQSYKREQNTTDKEIFRPIKSNKC